MEKYTIYCTEEQTKKALELGAPIEANKDYSNGKLSNSLCVNGEIVNKDKFGVGECAILHIPTAEQMIGWLRDKNIDCFVGKQSYARFMSSVTTAICEFIYSEKHDTLEAATIAAIDAALEYLINLSSKNKQK